jgi:predicted SAM-dependent methyltransferase
MNINPSNILKLHLGCGEKHIEGYTNVDIRKLPSVDVIDDITKLDFFSSNSASIIYASHVLEHIGRREYMNVLKRWYTILKNDGILRLALPDFEKVVEHYNENRNLELLRGFLYGGQDYTQNYHYCSWDFETLKKDLEKIGFKKIYRYDWRETDHSHIDDFSQCYLPHMDKDNGKLMSLNIEAVK